MMQDWRDDFELDEDGRPRRRKRHARDGEVEHFHMTMMDAFHGGGAGGATRVSDGGVRVVDGFGQAAGHRPGYAFIADDGLRDAGIQSSQDLHEQNKRRLSGLWKKRRKKPAPQLQGSERLSRRGGAYPPPVGGDGYGDDDSHEDGRELAGLTLDELQVRAQLAWEDRKQRLANGPWRNNR